MDKKLYLITGYLGSGKTTLMKNLLKTEEKDSGVVVNEFGNQGLDGTLLKDSGADIHEINNGSVFCSCKSDQFITVLMKLVETPLKTIFIETSGMSNPWIMPEILSIVHKQSKQKYDYRGCITVVGANHYHKLIKTNVVYQKQITFADYIIINKIDLCDDQGVRFIIDDIKNHNKTATIETASYCNLKNFKSLLDINDTSQKGHEMLTKPNQSGVNKLTFQFADSIDQSQLDQFIHRIAKETHRIKGLVKTTSGWLKVDCVNDDIHVEPVYYTPEQSYLVIIWDTQKPLSVIAKKRYKEIFKHDPITL